MAATFLIGKAAVAQFGTSLAVKVGAGLVGAYIDQNVLFKGLLGGDDPQPEQFQGVDVQSTGEDAPYNFCLGPQAVVTGNVIWTKRQYDTVQESQNGKGGPTQTVESFYTDVTYGICDTFQMQGIVDVERIEMDAKTFFSKFPRITLTDHRYGVTVLTEEIDGPVPGIPTIRATGRLIYQALEPSVPTLTDLEPGVDVTIENFISAPFNGTYRVIRRDLTDEGLSFIEVDTGLGPSIDPNLDTNGQPGATQAQPAVFTQDPPQFAPGTVADITIRKGTFDQEVIAEIEEEEGLGAAPLFSGQATATLRGLALVDFGNRIPNANFIVRAHDEITVGEALRQILLHYLPELGDERIDVSNLKDQYVLGYTVSGVQTVATMLQPLLVAFDIIASEQDGKLVFFDRLDVPPLEVDRILLGASGGGEGIVDVQINDTFDVVLPASVEVEYIDPDGNFEISSTKELRSDNPEGEQVVIRLPITMTAERARSIARRFLWSPEGSRQEVTVSLMPSLVDLHAGSVVRFTVRDKTYKMLIHQLDTGADWSVQASGVLILDSVENLPPTPTELGGATLGIDNGVYIPPFVRLNFFEAPPISASHINVPGVYAGMASEDFFALYLGGRVYRKSVSTEVYDEVGRFARESTIGVTLTALPTSNHNVINYTQFLEVRLFNGSLQTVELAELLNGANQCMFNGEVWSFLSASPIGNNKYLLRGLARGLRGTALNAQYINRPAGSPFMLINSGVQFHEVNAARLFQEDTYKGVALGGDLDDQPEVVHEHKIRTARPLNPVHIRGRVGFQGDIEITWNRVSLFPGSLLDTPAQPIHQGEELYNVQIYRGPSGLDVLRTFVVNEPRVVYLNSQRVADNNTNAFRVRIFQVGDFGDGVGVDTVLPNLK